MPVTLSATTCHRVAVAVCVAAAFLAMIAGGGTSAWATSPGLTPTVPRSSSAPTTASPSIPHVMILMMENQSYSDIVGSTAAPFQTRLSRTYETATNYYGVGHNSLDNYLAVLTGRFYDWATDDCLPGPSCDSSNPTFVTQLEDAHIPWDAYMGAMPTDCDSRNYDNGTIGHSYGVRHDPFVYVPALVTSDCDKIQSGSRMLGELSGASAPDFVWYSPEICDDAGGDDPCSTVRAGDRFLSKEIPAIQATSWYASGGVIVLTYDEGNGAGQGQGEYLHGSGNHVLTIVISEATSNARRDSTYVNHFGLLAGLEKAYGVPCLAQACSKSNGLLPLPAPGTA